MNPNGYDISSLYMDDGYLFFQVNPQESNIHNDTIDFDILMYEGKQATINKVSVKGNDKTNDHDSSGCCGSIYFFFYGRNE